MDIAGTVIGVVGLTGQILQGCNYICDFLRHAKDAPDSIRVLHTSVRNLIDVVGVVMNMAQNSDQQSNSMPASTYHLATLTECKSVVQDLEAFVRRFKTGKGTWQKFSWAVYQKQLKEYDSKINQAKLSVLMVQNNMLQMSEQLHHSTKLAQGQETLQRLEELPLLFRTIVQDEVKAALLVQQPQTSAKDTMSTNSFFANSKTQYNGHDRLLDLGQTRSGTRNTQCGLSRKRQTRQFRRRDTWFGHIEIRWTTTTQDYCSGQLTEYLTASSREIKVYVNTWLAKSVISFMTGDNQPKVPDLSFNNRLRFSRVHMGPRVRDTGFYEPVGDNSMESAVSRAIRCADVDTVHRLLRTREAHPRDYILVHTSQAGAHGTGLFYYSLFDFMIQMMKVAERDVRWEYGKANTSAYDFRLRHYTIAQQLIVFGAECSQFWSYLVAIAIGQDEWDFTEWRAMEEHYYGKGFHEYLLNGGRYQDWVVHQRSEWCKMIIGLRYSRKEVNRRFGWHFWYRNVEDSKFRRLRKRRSKCFDAEMACGEFFSGVEQQNGSGKRILSLQQAAHNDCAREGQNEIACADDDDASHNGGFDDESDGEGYVTADE
ncbi:hypothetical protein LTR93_006830 [Exophiala xenobiotica]|nr:hypothetical protein LTR93_006830 [Exophiala xenobiotica]KAK5448758.1 hypothetical protein LTR18_001846 [Exophiala xenobiotica]